MANTDLSKCMAGTREELHIHYGLLAQQLEDRIWSNRALGCLQGRFQLARAAMVSIRDSLSIVCPVQLTIVPNPGKLTSQGIY